MTWRWLVLFAVGCNQIYGLEPTRSRDAAIFEFDDTDRDGIADIQDNCPDLANADQGDTDGDRRGDLCDDCPLISNEQGIDADRDGLGDLCDPHPGTAGDCLLALDTFADPSVFFANWKLAGGDPAAQVLPEPGLLRLRPVIDKAPIEVTSLTSADATDVMVQGTASPPPDRSDPYPVVSAFSARETSARHYACRLIAPKELAAEGPGTSLPVNRQLVPSTPVNDKFVIRLITTANKVAAAVDVLCRVDHGVAVGTDTRPDEPMVAGPAGFAAASAESTLDAVALSKFQPETPCPPTLYR